MNLKIRYIFLALFIGLFLMQAGVFAQDTIGGDPPKAAKKDKTDTSKFEFPDVEGWEKNISRNDPASGLGDFANYDSKDGGRVTIYFYDAGIEKIPDDLTSRTLKDEMQNAKLGILQLGEMGVYKNIKEAKSDTIMLGGSSGKVKALHSLLYFTAGENDLVSEIFLLPYKNNFLKIRASRPKDQEKNKTFEKFMSEIDAYFSK